MEQEIADPYDLLLTHEEVGDSIQHRRLHGDPGGEDRGIRRREAGLAQDLQNRLACARLVGAECNAAPRQRDALACHETCLLDEPVQGLVEHGRRRPSE